MYVILSKSKISRLSNLLLENLAIFYTVHISNPIQTSLSPQEMSEGSDSTQFYYFHLVNSYKFRVLSEKYISKGVSHPAGFQLWLLDQRSHILLHLRELIHAELWSAQTHPCNFFAARFGALALRQTSALSCTSFAYHGDHLSILKVPATQHTAFAQRRTIWVWFRDQALKSGIHFQ